MSTMTPEMESLKVRLKAIWMAGDYGHFAKYLEPARWRSWNVFPLHQGRACSTWAAAQARSPSRPRAGVRVTGVDIAANSIEKARARAQAEGLDVRFDEGDAEMLAFADGSFDLVVSLIGAMFAPRPERVAAELVRVCRSGGRIVMANWTPEGFVGQMFKTIGKHVPPSPLMPSPLLWGNEAAVRERLQSGIAELRMTKRLYPFRYPFAPPEVVEFYLTYYGPTNRAFATLDAAGQAALRSDLEQLWTQQNRATDGTTRYEAEYLEVVAIRG
ncbi:class I SAM-dependent methyltransferase [Polaromonas sp. P1-6]|nr:class I SAM-dependent methyltransferase [Polaromonas sp. P1-6]